MYTRKMNSVILVVTAGILFEITACTDIILQKKTVQPIIAQHFGQDTLGRYTYGYITPTSTKSESKDADGIIRGGYSYFDPKWNLQTIHYVADPVHGFLVAASNLPQDLPSVAYAKQRHLEKYETIKAEHSALALSKQNLHPQLIHEDNVIVEPIPATSNLPKDAPVVAYAKQRHLENYEAIKAQHASIALLKQDPQAAVALLNPIRDLPAVVNARAQHLAAFEAIKARDLAIRAASEENLLNGASYNYIPIVPKNEWNYYSYGYIPPKTNAGLIHEGSGYSYMDVNGVIKTINYITN